jgi:hypothetical protein
VMAQLHDLISCCPSWLGLWLLRFYLLNRVCLKSIWCRELSLILIRLPEVQILQRSLSNHRIRRHSPLLILALLRILTHRSNNSWIGHTGIHVGVTVWIFALVDDFLSVSQCWKLGFGNW